MLNNENSIDRSPSKELSSIKKKIDLETQKSLVHDEKIKELQTKIAAAQKRNQQKRQILTELEQKIHDEKEKSESQSSSSGFQTNISSSVASSAVLDQLREHFKSLRQQLMIEQWGDDEDEYEDEVDVDNMTYEELLELGEKIGKVSKGLDTKKMESLQTKKYKNPNPNEPFDCAICRDQLEDGADCIQLQCHHVFHDECIKGWLNVEKHCPNCKREIKVGGDLSEKVSSQK